MRSKSWLVILVIGIAGFCALGFVTKFALESNPSLVRLGKMKQAIAEDFSSLGVGEVSVRPLPQRRGIEIRIETPRPREAEPARFAGEVAECFIRKYSGPPAPNLKVLLVEPPRMGCRQAGAFFEKEFSVAELAADMELRTAVGRLEESMPPGAGFKIRMSERGDPLKLRVEIPEPRNDADLERALSLLRSKCREHLGAGRTRGVVLSLWVGGPAPYFVKEDRIERSAPSRRRPAASAVPAGAAPAGAAPAGRSHPESGASPAPPPGK